MFTHMLQFELHATPYTLEVDGHHPVVIVSGRVRSLCEHILNAGIVVSCIEPPERGDRLFHHCLHLRVIGNVIADGQCLMTTVANSLAADCASFSFQSANTTEAPASAKALAVARPNPDAAPVTSATLFSKDKFMLF